MISDDERREVARRLREGSTLIPHKTGRHHGMGCHEAADRFWDMCDRIKAAGDYDIALSTKSVLADLIEPSEPKVRCVAEVKVDGERLEEMAHDAAVELTGIDRDALLQLAYMLQVMGERSDEKGRYDLGITFTSIANRIREALGVVEE